MKKVLPFLLSGFLVISVSAVAAPRGRGGECSYSPLQEFIRSVRSETEIQQLIDKGVNLNAKARCGGSVLQLAIRRGNPQVVKALLEASIDFESPVSLEGFPIQNAPKEVPLFMFAAYYSPRPEIISLLMQAGADVSALDENGENVLWYMKQNPVLRETDIYDEVNAILLYQNAKKEKGNTSAEGTGNETADDSHAAKSGNKRGTARRLSREIVEPDMPVEQAEDAMKKSDF